MRSYGTNKQLQARRQKALGLLKQGRTIGQVANKIGVTVRSIYRWRKEQKYPKKKSNKLLGKPGFLSNSQRNRLEKELLRGAHAHGYSEDYWTLDRIGRVIWDLFKIRSTSSGVWRMMDRMGWSCQKVQRLAIQRKDEVIINWKRQVWPRIKKVVYVESHARVNR